jgi:hypothetical protein
MVCALAATVVMSGGCPQGSPPPPADTDGPQDSADPPVPSSICEQIGGDDGVDDTAGAAEACPEETADGVRIDWYPVWPLERTRPGSAFFNTKNLLREEVEVEYQATAKMVDRDETFPLRFREPRRVYAPLGGGMTGMDLQLGVNLGALTEGEIEIEIEARLLRPTQTPMVQMSRVVVLTKHDEDGYIYDIDLVEW